LINEQKSHSSAYVHTIIGCPAVPAVVIGKVYPRKKLNRAESSLGRFNYSLLFFMLSSCRNEEKKLGFHQSDASQSSLVVFSINVLVTTVEYTPERRDEMRRAGRENREINFNCKQLREWRQRHEQRLMAFKNMKLNKKEFITILIPTSHQQARE
jgi:hypothetical protein